MEEENKKVEENVQQATEMPVESKQEQAPVVENIIEQPNDKKPKNNKPLLIVLLIIFMGFIFGCGLYLGKQLYEPSGSGNKESSTNIEKPTNTETINPGENEIKIIDVTEDIKSGTSESNIYITGGDNKLYINNKEVLSFNEYKGLGRVYSIEDSYLITVLGSDINSEHYYLYDNNGNLLQEIYELEDNNMVIASNDKYNNTITINNNIIELYGLRLYGTKQLVTNVNGLKTYLNICDDNEISKAKVDDSYVVVARYQLIYSNNKFDIKRIEGTEETLGQYKETCTNE